MTLWKRSILGLALLTLVAGPAMAASARYDDSRKTQVMVADVIAARPLGLLVTGLGAALFVVSLPFSALGGNMDEAAEALVLKPARETFTRCLGCTNSEQRRATPEDEYE